MNNYMNTSLGSLKHLPIVPCFPLKSLSMYLGSDGCSRVKNKKNISGVRQRLCTICSLEEK